MNTKINTRQRKSTPKLRKVTAVKALL